MYRNNYKRHVSIMSISVIVQVLKEAPLGGGINFYSAYKNAV